MVYGAIDRASEGFTDMQYIFAALGQRQRDYNWLITDADCTAATPAFAALLEQNYVWLTGEELTAMVAQENFQWIWAVLSGFPKHITQEEVLAYPLPAAIGYTGFWHNPLTLQHPLAEVEIVPWDSSATLFLSRDAELVTAFRRAIAGSQDLAQYNAI